MEAHHYMTYEGEKTKPAIAAACFHGECWYRCPWCDAAFEAYDAEFEKGFRKIQHGLYRHEECGKLVTVI